jgi:predicted MFS family arabinose efflux permease
VFGTLADRIGHRRILLAALMAFAAANLLTAFATTFALLLVARTIAGFAASGVTPTIYGLTGASAPPGQRARWLATVTSGLLLALATGAPAGSLLAAALGWHAVFAILSGAVILVLVMIALVTTPARHIRAPESPPAAAGGPTTAPILRPALGLTVRLRSVAVTGLWGLAVYGLYTYLGTILSATRHFSSSVIAAGLACYGVGAVLGNLAGGWLSDRYNPRRISAIGLLALATIEALVGLGIHLPAAALFILLGALALAGYPFYPAQQARLVAAFSTGSGAVLAWNSSSMYVGLVLGSLLGGPILTTYGPATLAYAAAATAALGAVAAAKGVGTHSLPSWDDATVPS